MALRAVADAVEVLTTDHDESVTVGFFQPTIRSGAALAEFLAAALPHPAKRNRYARDAGVTLYYADAVAEQVPAAVLLEALVYGGDADWASR